jgi:hypothetical protein
MYVLVPKLDKAPLTGFRLSDSQEDDDARAKQRKIRPTKRLPPPPAEQRNIKEIPDRSTASDHISLSAVSPLPRIISAADLLLTAHQKS